MVAVSLGNTHKLFTLVCGTLLMALIGCGGTAPPPVAEAKPVAENKPVPPAPAAKAIETAAAPAVKSNESTQGGRKFVGDIPYDVFFDDPLSVVADSTSVAAPAAPDMKTPSQAAPAEATPVAAGGVPDWKTYLTGDDIQSEIKTVRNHLNSSLQTLGTYNGGVKDIAIDGAVVSALARILSETSEEASWKKNAGLVEDYGLQIWEAASGSNSLGKESYEKVQAATEQLVAVLSGNVPADAKTPPADRKFSEIAHRKGMMKRIEKASEYLRANINTEGKLKGEQEKILHEAALIAAFGKACAIPSYESADEEDYQKYAGDLVGGAMEVQGAAKDQSFDKFQMGINKIQKACTDCHADYATGG
jgi:hypothetical protein